MRDEKIITGTGFLVKPDIVMTVKHNVLKADDLISDEFEEKEVIFRIAENDEVKGRTINLKESIENGIDCVFIRLEEVLSEDEMYELVDVDNEIEGIECHITGFPKLISGKSTLSATVSKIQQLLTISGTLSIAASISPSSIRCPICLIWKSLRVAKHNSPRSL